MLIKQLARGAYGASGNPDFPSSGKSKAKCVPCCESALPPWQLAYTSIDDCHAHLTKISML